MDIKLFQPHAGASIAVANAVAATTPALLDDTCDQVALYNTSTTAIVYWLCQNLARSTDAGTPATIPVAGGASGAMPIPPGGLLGLTVGSGFKKFSVIASGADGALIITPGRGL